MFSSIKSDFALFEGVNVLLRWPFPSREDFCDVIFSKSRKANNLKFCMFTSFMHTITSTKFQIKYQISNQSVH